VSPTYSNPWKRKGRHRQCGHENSCGGKDGQGVELLFNMMLGMGEGCDDV